MRLRLRAGTFGLDALAAFLVAATPVLVFTRHNGYGVLELETVVMLAWCLPAALAAAGLARLAGTWGRCGAMAVLLVLLVDVQTDWITTVGLRLLLTVLGAAVLVTLFRRRLSAVLVAMFGAMVLATSVLPAGAVIRTRGVGDADAACRPDLPPIVHVVLDGHIGPAGIPAEFDPDGRVAAQVTQGLLGHGCQVWSRAYSRYWGTYESLSNAFNFSHEVRQSAWFAATFRQGATLEANAWFTRLRDQGYVFHVVEPTFIDVLPDTLALRPGSTVTTYDPTSPRAIAMAGLAPGERLRQAGGAYTELSFFLREGRRAYGRLRTSGAGRALHLPDWDRFASSGSTLASLAAWPTFLESLAAARPGEFHYVHLLLPHGPYALDREGRVRPRPRDWRDESAHVDRLHRNNVSTRAEAYPDYLDQVVATQRLLDGMFATLERSGQADRTLVILHGDHGSRLGVNIPRAGEAGKLSRDDYLDGFSTLFAVRLPGEPAAEHPEPWPLDYLLTRLLSPERAGDPPPAPEVNLMQRHYRKDGLMETVPMPSLDRP
ncbi:MAG TPA: sulfatase-like hydrolase/transferase [Candidatus Krumholzibacteria bacterium]|nr:sulfatase-like hydrolase/transferase [Candidatus Krumholzibacteria bacterium]